MAYQYKIGEVINPKGETSGMKDKLKAKHGWETGGGGIPAYSQPEYAEIPTYDAPEFEEFTYEGDVKGLTQTLAAPGLRNLRHQMQNIQAQSYSNPNVKSMTLRQALAGYGAGLESVTSGARATAGQETARKEALEFQEWTMKQQSAQQAAERKYQSEYQRTSEENRRKEELAKMEYGAMLQEYYGEQAKEQPTRYAGSSPPGRQVSRPGVSTPSDWKYGKDISTQSYNLSALLSGGGGGGGYESAPLMSDEEWEKYMSS